MDKVRAERNITLYYLFQAIREPLFWAPILITYIMAVSGMSLSQVYFMESVCIWILIILEIPSGALADLIGRKKTVLIGTFLLCFDVTLFSIATSPMAIWIANCCWAVGFSLVSGADSSLIFDTLKYLGRDDEFQKIEGRSISGRLFIVAICSILVGYLAAIDIRLPIYCSLVFMIINCFISCLFVEPPVSERNRYSMQKHIDLMRVSVLFVANHKKIKWVVGFVILLTGISKVWFFSYNSYFELVDLPIYYFGWIFFFLNIVGAISSYFSSAISKKIGDFGSVVLMTTVIAIPVFVMGVWVSQLACLLVLMQNVTRGYLTPFISQFLHRYLDSENRATVISIKSAASGFSQFVMLTLFGVLLGIYSLPICLMIMGGIMTVGGLFFILTYKKVFSKN
jgi:MFS family permease